MQSLWSLREAAGEQGPRHVAETVIAFCCPMQGKLCSYYPTSLGLSPIGHVGPLLPLVSCVNLKNRQVESHPSNPREGRVTCIKESLFIVGCHQNPAFPAVQERQLTNPSFLNGADKEKSSQSAWSPHSLQCLNMGI